MSWIESKPAEYVLSRVHRDFGKEFILEGHDTSVTKENIFDYESGEKEIISKEPHITVFRDGRFEKVVRLYIKIPTFDSGDREYDSWHHLYLVREHGGHLRAVYATGGYRISTVYGFQELIACPPNYLALLD